MRPRTAALLGSIIAAVAVLWWLNSARDATRRDEAIATAAVRQDNLPHRDDRIAVDRAASNSAPRTTAVAQPAATVTPPTPAEPDAAGRRWHSLADTAAKAGPPARDLRPLSAEQILQAMRESYARLGSYTDRGRLTRTWHEARLVYVDVPFRTFFKRPLLYRFEWLADRDPYRESYWSNPAGFLVLKAVGASSRHTSFTGIFPHPESSIAPYHVLQLLAPQAARADARFLMSAVRLGNETIDGVMCFHLSGTATSKQFERHLWIGQDDFLLRRISTVAPHAYDLSRTPRYGSGTETVQVDYLDVTTDLSLPDELFYPPPSKLAGGN